VTDQVLHLYDAVGRIVEFVMYRREGDWRKMWGEGKRRRRRKRNILDDDRKI
jgi:hypothetical protein